MVSRLHRIALAAAFVAATAGVSLAQEPAAPVVEPAETTAPAENARQAEAGSMRSDEVRVDAQEQHKVGNLITYSGYVDIHYQNIRLQADRVDYDEATNEAVAEGNVIFDQGAGQRVTARRAEVNIATKLGTFYSVTGFTDRTATGEFLYYVASRVDKVGPDVYVLHDPEVTACEDSVPKWSFKARKAELRVNDRVRLRNAVFEIKDKPILYLPYASVPIDRKERQSGLLLPRIGSSNTKGFTYTQAYYQTLGRSADLLLRTDLFSARGLGFGFEFRARTDERSGIRLGSYVVQDRLWGDPGPDQGGSAFFVEGVQYLPNGWLAVADVRVTSNLEFRRTFSDSFEEIINPEERSTFFLNNNHGRFSFNFLIESDSTTIHEIDDRAINLTTDFTINIRHLASFDLALYDRLAYADFPVYFGMNAAIDGLRRREAVGDASTFATPNIVQRFDINPRFTFPLPWDMGGWALTPFASLRATFYSNSLDPGVPRFDPRIFTIDPLEAAGAKPPLFYDPLVYRPVTAENVGRAYVEAGVDIRPPALYRTFLHEDGTPWFKHVIEPYLTYRIIAGISNFERIPRFDERDAVANTHELEYGVTNRFFLRKLDRKSADGDSQPHDLLSITVRQKYFFDPTFDGALQRGERNQFFPINTFSGFSYGGIERRFSPINVTARLRPLWALYGDVRLDYDMRRNTIRDVGLTAGVRRRTWSLSESWYYSRVIPGERGLPEPGTFDGNQWVTSFDLGDSKHGVYGGSRLNLDFSDRIDRRSGELKEVQLLNTRTYLGYAWDCCGIQANYMTFDLPSGQRSESQFFISFTLAGLGTLGNENFGQPAQTRRLHRGRRRDALLDDSFGVR
jgi:LPS-assembly protein